MARGDITVFEEHAREIGESIFDYATDTLKVALLTNAVPPTAADLTPRLADYTQVTGGGYTAGGETLTYTFLEANGDADLKPSGVTTWTQNGTGPIDIYWGLIYSDTALNDEAIAFIDMGGPVSLQAGDVSLTWNATYTIRYAA